MARLPSLADQSLRSTILMLVVCGAAGCGRETTALPSTQTSVYPPAPSSPPTPPGPSAISVQLSSTDPPEGATLRLNITGVRVPLFVFYQLSVPVAEEGVVQNSWSLLARDAGVKRGNPKPVLTASAIVYLEARTPRVVGSEGFVTTRFACEGQSGTVRSSAFLLHEIRRLRTPDRPIPQDVPVAFSYQVPVSFWLECP
jgi:hypothetical protein